MQTPKRKRYTKDTTPSDDIVTLIHLVRQNPALYNYKLQPNQRRRIDVLSGWAHISAQIGNKYSVEECRRKWKNLRDTYHQYRLRKPKLGDSGLAKWRYAKELEFLSTVYQPKLKSHRQPHHNQHLQLTTISADHQHHQQQQHEHDQQQQQHYDESDVGDLMQSVVIMPDSMHDDDDEDDAEQHEVEEMDGVDGVDGAGTDEDVKNSMQVHHSPMDAETFILTAYEDEDEVGGAGDEEEEDEEQDHHNPHHHHQHHLTHHHHHTMELSAHNDDVCRLVKNESSLEHNSLDDDGDGGGCAGAEVDYEEVCLYEESDAVGGGAGETIIGTRSGGGGASEDSKSFQYIDASEFCLGPISNAQLQPSSSSSGVSNASGGSSRIKLKLSSAVVVTATPPLSTSATMSASQVVSNVNVGDIVVSSVRPPATIVQLTTTTTAATTMAMTTASTLPPATAISSAAAAAAAAAQTQTREELDLFFDFLKKKMSRFTQEEITVIQVEFLNCVLRRESEQVLKTEHVLKHN